MRDLVVDYQRTERKIKKKHFYPVHLTSEELNLIIQEIFGETISGSSATLAVSVRADRGGKGIDFRLEETLRKPHQVVKQRMFSFGLNANWKIVDFFEHYTQSAGASTKTVAGKVYAYPRYVAQEYTGYASREVDAIYERRLASPSAPERNLIFQHDNWTCVYEQAHHLSGN